VRRTPKCRPRTSTSGWLWRTLLRLCLLMLGEAALAWALSWTLLGVSICEQHGVNFGIILKRLSNLI